MRSEDSLPEFDSLPNAKYSAECFFSGTRQISFLPSAKQKTLGKRKHSAKKRFVACFIFDTRQRASLPSAKQKTLGKRKHSAKKLFVACFIFETRKIAYLPSAFFEH
jgi:hypothetical protein